uniref:Uncharacterized protein n=3 Tax=Lygus hesperus TaxID=30085 RepID=A0A0A9XYJ1_LYGHE
MILIHRSMRFILTRFASTLSTPYVQGQSPRKNLREYFYFVDHNGMLFLDDARMKNFTSCFKDKEFLIFFFKRIRPNETERYPEFPYISLCGRERNYIRCDDTPLVFTHVKQMADLKNQNVDGEDAFCYGHAGDLMHLPFKPDKLFMSPQTGRVYHPCEERFGSVGLVMSKLAIEISPRFTFEHGDGKPPTKFEWKGKVHDLDNQWYFKYRSRDDVTTANVDI